MSVTDCAYPLFRSKFFAAASWQTNGAAANSSDMIQTMGTNHTDGPKLPTPPLTSPTSFHRPALRNLDLKAIPRDDGPPSETQLRRQKYLFFEKHCSEVGERLFLAGDYVAKNKEILTEHAITHVLNCVGFVCKEYFKGELTYKTLYLQDTPAEDILCVLYDAFDFIDRALQSGGRVLVHCSQGVSRSATLSIAYLMWKSSLQYDEVFAKVKSIRGIANPNIGFTCQLLQWQKRRNTAPTRMRMYRIVPHCPHASTYLVPKLVTPPKKYPNNTFRELDPRGAFIVHTQQVLYIWRGAQCPLPYMAAAEAQAQLLLKYESGTYPPILVQQGMEPDAFITLMDPPMLDPEQERINARRASITGEISLLNTISQIAEPNLGDVDGVEGGDADPMEISAFDDDLSPISRENSDATSSYAASPTPFGNARMHHSHSAALAASRPSNHPASWCIQEVDEYTEDYKLFSDGSKPDSSGMRMSYDALRLGSDASMLGLGLRPLMTMNAAVAQSPYLDPAGRPESPGTSEGRMKKYRRAESDRLLSNLGQSDGGSSGNGGPSGPPVGGSLQRRHFPSLHHSIDEEDMIDL